MKDFASLRFAIDSKDLKLASLELDKLTAKGKKADTASAMLTKTTIGLGIAFYGLTSAIKSVSTAGMEMESIEMALDAAVGSSKQATQEIKYLKEEVDDLGLSFRTSIKGFSQFAAAAKQTELEGQGVRDVFSGVSQAATVMGLSADNQQGVFRALTQIMSKGKVQAEELRGQLGERLPGAFQIASRAMSMTTAELDKFMADGKLISEDFLPKFAKQLETEFGGAATKAAKTARAEQARFNNELLYAKVAINEMGLEDFTKDFYQLGSVVIKEATHWLHEWNIQAESLKDIKADAGLSVLTDQYKLAVGELDKLQLQEKSFQEQVTSRMGIMDILIGYTKSDVSLNAEIIKQKAIVTKLERTINRDIEKSISNLKNINDYKKEDIELTKEQLKFLQLTNKAQNEATSALEAYNQQLADAHDSYIGIVGSEYDKWILDVGNKINGLGNKGELTNEQLLNVFETLSEERELGINLDGLDETYDGMTSILDMQIELAESGTNWADSLDGTSGNISNISKALSKIDISKLKYEKSDIKLQKDYAKSFLKANGDITKEKELEAKFDEDQSQLNETRKTAEISGYANLAGAIGGAFEEGSSAAIAFQTIQNGLALTNAVGAVIQAWNSAPFPANLPAVATTSAAVVGLLGQIGQSFSSGSDGGGGSTGLTTEQRIEGIEDTYNPTIERLDRQIELLEAIDRNGSASALSVQLASATFERDYGIFVEESLSKVWDRMNQDFGGAGSGAVIARTENAVEEALGFNLVDVNLSNWASTTVDKDALREGFNFAKLLEGFFTGVLTDTAVVEGHAGAYQAMLDMGWEEAGRTPQQQYEANLNSFISGYQDLISDFTLSLLDSMQELKDAGEDFKEAYDSVTGTTFYQAQRLEEAFSDVDRLRDGLSFSEYLKNEVENIANLQDFLTEDKIELLLLEDPTKLEEQINLVQELEKQTGITFENGAKDALNYLESIELVTDAMVTSRENIKDWNDSFKSSDDLLADLANSMGVDVATNLEELNSLFDMLSGGVEGLNDAELELLETNKDYLESIGIITSAMMGIDVLSPTLDTLQQTIDKLRASSTDSTYSLDRYYESMAKTKDLLARDDYTGFAKSLSETTGLSSALYDITAFDGVTNDMLFAQAVAANQFEAMQVDVLTEIDILKEQNVLIAEQNALITELLDVQNASLGELQSIEEAS